jgi:cyclopropane fatty-acyl-phospholipid synthase-like methyltransferase
MANTGYRQQLYENYVRGCTGRPAEIQQADPAAPQPYYERLLRLHMPSDRGLRILELGCGAGGLIALLRRKGYANVAGVDASPEQVAAAGASGIEGVRQADLFEALRQLSDDSQDVIVAFDVIEHLTKDEALELAVQVNRVLSPEGRWIIHTVNAESPFFGRVRYGDFTHETAFTQRSMRQLLSSAGFGRVASYENRPVVHGVKSFARAVVWQAVRNVLRVAIAAETGDLGRDAIMSQNFLTVAQK